MVDTTPLNDVDLAARVPVVDRYAALRGRLRGHVIWARDDMGIALVNRDVATIFRLLQRFGMSQRVIAALTGQSQSDISEILAGRRVTHYDVLTRIAAGLCIPAGRIGLAYDPATEARYVIRGLASARGAGAERAAEPVRQPTWWEIFDSGPALDGPEG